MKTLIIVFSLIMSQLLFSTASATTILPITLEQLSTRASLIFYGKVISNQVKKDAQSGRIATFTEFEVIDLIKGKTGHTHIIKQIGGIDKESNIQLLVHGVPEFHNGEEYVVFLPEKSVLGFSSPLGLHQGRFSVSTVNNEHMVSNGRNMSQQSEMLLRNVQVPLAVQADKPSYSRLDDFINTVRAYNSP